MPTQTNRRHRWNNFLIALGALHTIGMVIGVFLVFDGHAWGVFATMLGAAIWGAIGGLLAARRPTQVPGPICGCCGRGR